MSTKGKVKGIIANLVVVEVDGPISQNEICYIVTGSTKLMAEVIKINGDNAYVQSFESTRGVKIDDHVDFAGHMEDCFDERGFARSAMTEEYNVADVFNVCH